MPRFLGAIAWVCLFGAPVAAQMTVRVADADGRPIPAVQVGLYGRAELIDSRSTSVLGVADLSSNRWAEVRYILLSHLAYQTLIVQAADLRADRVIRLHAEVIAIDGIDVTASEPCPTDDDPEARSLWSAVASRYSRETGSRALSAYFARYQDGMIRAGELHRNPDGQPTGYVFAGDQSRGPSLDDRIETEGYAWPPLRINGVTTGRYREWAHPELDRSEAFHFASPVFGELHNFGDAVESDGQVTLTFCGNRKGKGGTMNGTITLVPGEALVSAEWRFRTSVPDEGVGGSVLFGSYLEAPGTPPHLVASRGIFFRRSGPAPKSRALPIYYERQISAEQRWYVHPLADHPCNTGSSLYLNPPRRPEDVRFGECIAAHWRGR